MESSSAEGESATATSTPEAVEAEVEVEVEVDTVAEVPRPRKERSTLVEYHPVRVSSDEMMREYDRLTTARPREEAAAIDTVLADLQVIQGQEDTVFPAVPVPVADPKSTEDLLAILEDGHDEKIERISGSPKNLNRALEAAAGEFELELELKPNPRDAESFVIEKTSAKDPISFIESDWADDDAPEAAPDSPKPEPRNGETQPAEKRRPEGPPVGKRGSRLIKKKIIWDPDNPATYRFASESINRSRSSEGAEPPKPKTNKTPTKASPGSSDGSISKRKKMSEVDKLLMDEGAVNMIYQLERSNNSDVPDLALKPNSKSMISISKERRNLMNKTKIIKNTVFSIAKCDDHENDAKALRTRRECVKKTFKKPNAKNSIQSPSRGESSVDAVADESRIIRRHSSSSFSSGCLSPRPQSPSELSANSSKNHENDSIFEKVTPHKSSKNNSYFHGSTPSDHKFLQATSKFRGLKRKHSNDVGKKIKLLNNHCSSDMNSNIKHKKRHVFSQMNMEIKDNVANITIKSDRPYGMFDAKLFQDFNSAFETMLKYDVNILCITSHNQVFSSGIDLRCSDEGSKDQILYLEDLMHQFRYFVMSLLRYRGIVVIGIDGECSGVGITILSLADFVLASNRSVFNFSADFRRSLPTEGLSLFDEMCSMVSKVKQEFILFNRKFDAADALKFGLVSNVCETEKYSSTLNKFIKNASETSKQVFSMHKRTLRESKLVKLMENFDDECASLTKYWNSSSGQDVIEKVYASIK